MKKTLKKITAALLCSLMLISALVSCSQTNANGKDNTDKPNINEQTAPNQNTSDKPTEQKPSGNDSADTGNDINIDSYEEQISYYMSLVETLQADIVKLREEAYIDECEYQLKISELEDTVEMLKKTISSLSGENKPSGSIQDPNNDNLSAKSDYEYTINDGKVTITKYIGRDIEVKIPSKIDGAPVVKIGEAAFSGFQIRSVTIPSGVKEIDWFAFSGCTVLESIYIPSSVTSVGYGAFDYCPKTLIIKCEKGSYIEAYALSWGMKVNAQ